MTAIFPLCLLAVFFICVAMSLREGLWGNTISFFNVLFASLIATNYYEPVANWADKMLNSKQHDWHYVTDFACLWAVFALAMVVLRFTTDKISRTQVRFKLPMEWVGSVFFGVWTAWLVVCFTTFTLHTAPLPRSFLWGAFYPTPTSSVFFGAAAPDREWLAYMHTMSIDGSLARSKPEGRPEYGVFDPRAEFILKYGERRHDLEIDNSGSLVPAETQ